RVRRELETNKSIDKAKKEEWRKTLLMPLNTLSMRQITPMLRELGLPTSPTDPAHVKWFLEHWELPEANAEHFIEAMEHGIPHNVLNAKYHEKEALIIAEAGRKGAVTIATNMAGRGVDILLGGSIAKQEPKPESENGAATDDAPPQEEISFRRGGKVRAAPPLPLSEQERSAAAEEV
ncbi:MAG: hypothetical protein NZ481_10130, partial [Candidatus Kapabacteria bacterium]|nr:hypothetical protein [Candidatus Kapabacteria bacterium]